MNDWKNFSTINRMLTGARIAYLRKLRGLSRAALADSMCVNQSTVAYWERGDAQPRQQHFEQLLKIFNVTAAEFYAMPLPEAA